MIVRAAHSEEGRVIAEAVHGQPLLQRYGVTKDGLARSLDGAIANGEHVLVADDGAVAGFAWYMRRGTFGIGGYLRLLSVATGHEGRGVGAKLLEAVEDDVAREVPHMFLLVSGFNADAQRFYARAGYVQRGTLPGFVIAEVDEQLWYKRLR